jgi:aminomethyltransferase
MHDAIQKQRFIVKAFPAEGSRPTELSSNMKPHPLSYMELPFDPEYSIYNNRLTPECLSHATPDEMYWAVRQKVIFRHTGEYPVEIAGPDAEVYLNRLFPRDVSKVKVGRCSYQFACYHDGGMITDGVLLRLAEGRFWMAQADGDMFSWYKAHLGDLNVRVFDPEVWVSQVQGPRSMDVLRDVVDSAFPVSFRYFDIAEVSIAGEPVIITRTGFSNELGWEMYLRPENDAQMVGDRITEVGKTHGMLLTGTPVFRARRIEAGLLAAGADFDGTVDPFAAGLGHFLDLEKQDFIGRRALKEADKRPRTWGMRVRGGIANRGRVLSQNGSVVGLVCSSAWSPYQECGVAIVRMDNPEMGPGTELDVACIDGAKHSAQLCTLPMYDTQGAIVRGKDTIVPQGPKPWRG